MITPQDQLTRYSTAELISSANEYFKDIGHNSIVMRKPFDHPNSMGMLSALAAMVQGADVRPRHTVVDFGCGTAWLSRIFAYCGCRVHAIDVSANALNAGEALHACDIHLPKNSITYHVFDGENIPLPDQSVERVFCNASFHHVWNQEKILAEFYRILKPGGVASFHEPGPKHAFLPQSQMEMRDTKVLENNIVVEEIDACAQRMGFQPMRLAFFFPWAESLSLADFNQMISRTAGTEISGPLLDRTAARFDNLRVFFLSKPGKTELDSTLLSDGLKAKLTLLQADLTGPELDLHLLIENTGKAFWLPSQSGVGEVNLGVHLYSGDALVALDYFRADLSATTIEPGQEVRIAIRLPRPVVPHARLAVDLVAEGVTWFENANNQVISIPIP